VSQFAGDILPGPSLNRWHLILRAARLLCFKDGPFRLRWATGLGPEGLSIPPPHNYPLSPPAATISLCLLTLFWFSSHNPHFIFQVFDCRSLTKTFSKEQRTQPPSVLHENEINVFTEAFIFRQWFHFNNLLKPKTIKKCWVDSVTVF